MPHAPLILVVEDEHDIRALLSTFLEGQGYRVATASERSVGAEILRAAHPALLVSNIRLRGGNGNDLAKLARALDIPVLFISGEPTAIEEFRYRTVPFLQKPFRPGARSSEALNVRRSGFNRAAAIRLPSPRSV
jgi:two-component system, OmpR family, response regulator